MRLLRFLSLREFQFFSILITKFNGVQKAKHSSTSNAIPFSLVKEYVRSRRVSTFRNHRSYSLFRLRLSRETEKDWDRDLADDVKGECEQKYGQVEAIKVEKETQV